MTIARYLLLGLTVSLLPSCGLVQSALRIPASILRTAGRTVGVSRLSDAPAQPVAEQEKPAAKAKEQAAAE